MACEISVNTIPLEADIVYMGDWNGYGDIDTYSYTMIENETITFTVNINQVGSLPNATLKLYRIEGNNIISLGVSYLRNAGNTFIYDGIIGDYFFCLESLYSATYDVSASFTDYTGITFINMIGNTGEYSDSTFPEVIPKPCTNEVAYKLINGTLPTGLKFESSGIISGNAGEQDCDSRSDEAPSWNWKRVDQNDGSFHPTYKEYPFQVRAYLLEYPFVWADKWFKICVHNNWNLDPADILNLSRTEYTVHENEVELPKQSELCPPCTEINTYTTERIINFRRYDIDAFKEQFDKLLYEKQCKVRHKIPYQEPLYLHVDEVKEDTDLCPICPDTDIDK